MGKKAPNLSVQPDLSEDMAEVMMDQVSWMGKVLTGWVLCKASHSSCTPGGV